MGRKNKQQEGLQICSVKVLSIRYLKKIDRLERSIFFGEIVSLVGDKRVFSGKVLHFLFLSYGKCIIVLERGSL